MNEQEEFEFRKRMEDEQAAQPAPTAALPPPAANIPVPPTQEEINNFRKPKSGYAGIPEDQLAWWQKADRALAMPGHEMFSPGSLAAKRETAEHGADFFTAGYLPQIVGRLKGGAFGTPEYIKARDEMVAKLAGADPGTKAAGMALGTMATMGAGSALRGGASLLGKAVPQLSSAAQAIGGYIPDAVKVAVGAAPTKTAIGQLARAAGTGAAYGFAANPGDTPGEMSPPMIEGRLQNAKRGALLSGALAAPFALKRLAQERLAAQPSQSADEIIKTAEKLGIPQEQVPTEMLTSDQVVRDKAAALKRDPTFGGEIVRRRLQPFQDTLQNTAEGLVSEAAPVTESGASVGSRVRSSIPEKIEADLAPAKEAYDRLTKPMEKAEPRQHSFKVGTTKMMEQVGPADSTGELGALIQREKEHFLNNVNSVADIKQYRTDIGKRMSDAYSKGDSRTGGIYSQLYDILTRERDRSLMRSIVDSKKIGGKAIAANTLADLKGADRTFRKGVSDAFDALGIEGRRSQPPQATVNDFLNSKSVDQLPDILWSPKDTEQAQAFQKNFPSEFEQIRKYQLGKVSQAASKGPSGQISASTLNTQLAKMTPEAQTRILGQNASVLPEFRSLLKAVPDPNFNPSQTDIRRGALTNWHPMNQAHSLAGAAELSMRRPLPYVNNSGPMQSMSNVAGQAGALYSKAKSGTDPAKFRSDVTSKLANTPYAAQLATAKSDQDFALRYFALSQSDPNFRAALEGKQPSQ